MINQKEGAFGRKASFIKYGRESRFSLEILFKCKTSQITINQMIDIAGKEVRIN